MKTISILILLLLYALPCQAETWVASAYCSCVRCCGKNDGITASGHHLMAGDRVVACNWLPFHTKLLINGVVYYVEDRGARSHFGTRAEKRRRLDIWFPSHQEALKWGKRKVNVEIMKGA